MSELGDLRKLFTRCVTQLLIRMLDRNYQPMIGKDGLKHMKKEEVKVKESVVSNEDLDNELPF